MKYGIAETWSTPITKQVQIAGKRSGDYVKCDDGETRHVGFLIPEPFIERWNEQVAKRIALENAVKEHSKVFYQLGNEISKAGLRPT